MGETIQIGEIAIALPCKDIKQVHSSMHAPSGPRLLVAPQADAP